MDRLLVCPLSQATPGPEGASAAASHPSGDLLGAQDAPLKIGSARRFPVISECKRNGFDSLRLFFAVLVVFSHSFPLAQGDNAREPLARLAFPPLVPGDELTLGTISVWAFFVLSGFLITKSWQRSPSPWSYLLKRVKRIYPGFVVAVFACALLNAALAREGTRRFPGLWNLLSHGLRLQMFDGSSIFHANPFPDVINGSLWSIQYEFWCYVLVLAMGFAGLLRSGRWLIVLFLFVAASHAWIDYRHWLPGGMLLGSVFGYPLFWTRVLPFFLAGMFFALHADRIELRPSYAAVSALLLIAAIPIPYAPYVIYPIFGSYLLLFLAFDHRIARLNLGRHGDFSYGAYLYAFPIQQSLAQIANGRLTPIELFLLSAPLSLGAGALSWFLVERRFLSRASERAHEQH